MPSARDFERQECCAQWQQAHGQVYRAPVLHLGRHRIAFESPHPWVELKTSQVLQAFRVLVNGRVLYAGRAVVTGLIPTSSSLLVEVRVDDDWEPAFDLSPGALPGAFAGWLRDWHRHLHIDPAFKERVFDLQAFLMELRVKCDQAEIAFRSGEERVVARAGSGLCENLAPLVEPQLRALFEWFEGVTEQLGEDRLPVHAALARRMLHPFLLCSPFVNRTYHKPLGYAGDYAVVDMMFCDPCAGESLLARIVNYYALQLPPIRAHRNRIDYLSHLIDREALRLTSAGGSLRYLSVGCGPAREVQGFMRRSPMAADVDFTLVDFDAEAVRHVREVLASTPTLDGRQVRFRVLRQSLLRLLRPAIAAGGREALPTDASYDLICCAGLFDYLPDMVCRQALQVLLGMLRPGGCLVVTNVGDNPCRFQMEICLDWHVMVRNRRELLALLPPGIATERVECHSELTGVNLLMEIRQPESARARGPEFQTRPG